jgi:hypothetical protein
MRLRLKTSLLRPAFPKVSVYENQTYKLIRLSLSESQLGITATLVWCGARDGLCLRRIHLGGDSCCFFRASCFSTCLMRTLPQENFAPSFIRSKMAFSPSRLMVVRFLRSTTSLRPPRSWHAFLQLVRSSATQGPMRVPSTTSLRCDCVSTTEILNMFAFVPKLNIATRLPKPRSLVP